MTEDNSQQNPHIGNSFTVDSESSFTQEVPSITRLLNRKAFTLNTLPSFSAPAKKPRSTPLSDEPPPFPDFSREKPTLASYSIDPTKRRGRQGFDEPPIEGTRTLTQLFRRAKPRTLTPEEKTKAESRAGAVAGAKIQPAGVRSSKRRGEQVAFPLISWNRGQLARTSDPLGVILLQLLDHGIEGALFMSIKAPRDGQAIPHFLATAAVGPDGMRAIWQGLCWEPEHSAELWNAFVNTGVVELPGSAHEFTQTDRKSLVRAAFGVLRESWLTLVRMGPPEYCRGVLALVSNQSVLSTLTEMESLLNSLPKKKPSAA